MSFSQNKNTSIVKAKIACDCKDAVQIKIEKNNRYGTTASPEGFGAIQEIVSSGQSDKMAFEKEHNSAWYLLSMKFDGEFVFEIVPEDTLNDYDFLFYKYIDSNTCTSIINKNALPIRSNISRNKARGETGLSAKSEFEFIKKGVASAFSKSVKVKAGEKYLLVLDNVYPQGKGHTIYFSYLKNVSIAGKVINSDSVPIVAEVTLSDNKGNIVELTKSNTKGEYKINTAIKENTNYNLTYLNDSSFTATATINTNTLKNSAAFENIKTVLPKLKRGEKYKMGNINFHGNSAVLLLESAASVNALYLLMKKNKKMILQIEGHVNDPGEAKINWNKILSEQRAKAIYDYLVRKGIAKERMTTIGLGASQMLFPMPIKEEEAKANRRVEIKVISIK